MFIKIPFENCIEFKTNISEITKMSLEHDFNVNDSVVLGNFYVTGEYKAHEVSINKDTFNYTLPFTVDLREDLKKETIEFNIEDFNYEIIDNKVLKVNIEYSLKAELAEEELFERVNDTELESELLYIDNFLEEEKEVENVMPEEIKEEKNEPVPVLETKKELLERMTEVEEKTIMNTIKDSDDTFVTYHIHIVKESESIESICKMYNVPNSLIIDYNNLDSFSIGDKVLIPKLDE